MKCSNCDGEALFVYDVPSVKNQGYCADHLTRFMRDNIKNGTVIRTDAYLAVQEEAVTKTQTTKPKRRSRKPWVDPEAPTETVVESTVTDEVVDDSTGAIE